MRCAPIALAVLLVQLLAGCSAPIERAAPARSSFEPTLVAATSATPEQGSQTTSGRSRDRDDSDRHQWSSRDISPGTTLLQGYLGAFIVDSITVEGSESVDFAEEPDLDELPLIGGGGQWVLGGERVDFGLEGGVAFAFSTDGGAVIVGGSGALVAVSVDLLLADLYGGFFASTFLGDKVRVYGAAGPLLQFADYQQEGDGLDDDGSGFGFGYYVRAGFEVVLASRTMLGLGARWSDSTIDVGGELGDIDLSGTQVFLSVTTGL